MTDTQSSIVTYAPFWNDRAHVQHVVPYAQMLERSGVVDSFWLWDQLTSWWPRHLWNTDNTALAETVADCDSYADPYVICGMAAAVTQSLGVKIDGTDATRRGPAELMQTMLTLAAATGGNACVALGAGELKQFKPFGYRRSEGLARLEDTFRIVKLLWECDGPIDFEGNVWKFEKAYVGTVRPERPRFYALGGGPRLIEIAARYADGFVSAVPAVFSTPDQYAAEVQRIRGEVERYGRDPDDFDFGIDICVMMHEDPAQIDAALDNPLLKFFASIAGRFNHDDWEKEGVERVYPPGFHYALKHLPTSMSDAQVDDVVARVPREMVERSASRGEPADLVSVIGAYIEAGATHVSVADLMVTTVRDEAEAFRALERTIELYRLLKEKY